MSLARETVGLAAGHCVGYHEAFASGDASAGAYVCQLTIAAERLELLLGGPARALVPAAAREYLTAAAINPSNAARSGPVSNCTPEVTARLQMQVQLMCKAGKSKCTDTDSCPTLLGKIAALEACILAR